MAAAQHTLTGSNRPQLSALSRRDSLVTIQIGGNDVGFGTVLATCAALSLTDPWGAPCRAHYTSGGTDRLGRAIAALGPRIAALLAGARHRAPRARVLLLGYPDLLPVRGSGCWPEVPLARGDVAYLRGEEMRMNGMLAAQAARAGDTYVNTFAASVGHDACQPAGVKWVEGLVPSSVALPFHPERRRGARHVTGSAGRAALEAGQGITSGGITEQIVTDSGITGTAARPAAWRRTCPDERGIWSGCAGL